MLWCTIKHAIRSFYIIVGVVYTALWSVMIWIVKLCYAYMEQYYCSCFLNTYHYLQHKTSIKNRVFDEIMFSVKVWFQWNALFSKSVFSGKLCFRWNGVVSETVLSVKLCIRRNWVFGEIGASMKLCIQWNCAFSFQWKSVGLLVEGSDWYIRRMCKSSSDVNIDMYLSSTMCITESRPGSGHMCTCNSDRCNGTPSQSGTSAYHLLTLLAASILAAT